MSSHPIPSHPIEISNSRCTPAHPNQSLHTNHPVSTFLHLIHIDIHLDLGCSRPISTLNRVRNLNYLCNGIRFQKILVVKMVEEDIEALASIVNLCFVC
jgi:hypothetical protein